MRPADALIALADQLRPRGFTALYGSACNRFGVPSVVYGMTVWTDGLMLWWGSGDEETGWPAANPDGAARLLLREEP